MWFRAFSEIDSRNFLAASAFGVDFLYPDNSPADFTGAGFPTGCSEAAKPTLSGICRLTTDDQSTILLYFPSKATGGF